MVSVVIPAHDEEDLIGRAVASVIQGGFDDLEIVVVLDRCTDATGARALEAGASLVRVVENTSWPGIAGALNTGIASAQGEWIARLDADDTQLADRFQVQLQLAMAEKLDLCGGWAEVVDERGAPAYEQRTPPGSAAIRRGLVGANVIVHSSVLMRRTMVDRAGGYRRTLWEDYDLWVRMSALKAAFGAVQRVVVRREFRPQGYGAAGGLAGRIQVMRHRARAVLALVGCGAW